MDSSFRSLAHRFDHFIAGLNVFQLRLQEQGFGVQFVSGGGIGLGEQCGALLELLGGEAARFGAKREKFFGDFYHFAGAFQLVVGGLDAEFDFFFNAREILLGLGKLGGVLANGGAPFAAIKEIVAKMKPERAEIAGEEGDVFLVAVAGEGFEVGDVLAFGETYGSRGLIDFGAGFGHLWVRFESDAEALFALAGSAYFADGGVECEGSGEGQADGVVELHGLSRQRNELSATLARR